MSHPSANMSLNESFMNRWKVAGEFESPKNITVGSNSPFGVMNAAFHSSPSLIRMLLYPDQMSNFVNSLASLTLLMRSEMRGRGYASLMVCSLTYL